MKAFLSARNATFLLVPLFALALSCGEDDPVEPDGGGGGGGGSNTGVFVDSPVQGLSYSSGALSGVTSATGGFTWEKNANIQFSVGDIVLPGPNDPAVVMSPVMIANATDVTDPTATNVARFLQTIDDDGNAANGIVITAAVRAVAAGHSSVSFTQSIAGFENDTDVLAAVAAMTSATTAGERSLVDTADAQAQLADGILSAYEGSYSGNYCVDGDEGQQTDGGRWTLTVGEDGSATLRFSGAASFTLVGVVSLSGEFSAFDPVASVFGGFGTEFSGRWYSGSQSGSFSEDSNCDR